MALTLGDEAQAWNLLAEHHKKTRSFVEREYDRLLLRSLINDVSSTEFKVLAFIKGRTLGWQKYAEAIPYSHFTRGIRDKQDEYVLDSHGGTPVAKGINIVKEDTVRIAVHRLKAQGLLTVFPGGFRTDTPSNVYLAMGRRVLCHLIVEGGGWLPDFAPYTRGEYLLDEDEKRVLVLHKLEDQIATVSGCREWGSPLGRVVTMPISRLRRMDPDEWDIFKANGVEKLARVI